jgi:hypothetical protein
MPYFIVATEIVNTKLCLTFILFAGIIADGLDSGVRYWCEFWMREVKQRFLQKPGSHICTW